MFLEIIALSIRKFLYSLMDLFKHWCTCISNVQLPKQLI